MKSIDNTLCPACGYDLNFPAWRDSSPSDAICPSCGIQFGYDDATPNNESGRMEIYIQWRQDWINEGMPWRSAGITQPFNWNPQKQLCNIRQ